LLRALKLRRRFPPRSIYEVEDTSEQDQDNQDHQCSGGGGESVAKNASWQARQTPLSGMRISSVEKYFSRSSALPEQITQSASATSRADITSLQKIGGPSAPASTSVLLGPPREMMVAGNDSDQYFGWRVPTALVQGLTGTISTSSQFSTPERQSQAGICHAVG
jgi:hypothetical protein